MCRQREADLWLTEADLGSRQNVISASPVCLINVALDAIVYQYLQLCQLPRDSLARLVLIRTDV